MCGRAIKPVRLTSGTNVPLTISPSNQVIATGLMMARRHMAFGKAEAQPGLDELGGTGAKWIPVPATQASIPRRIRRIRQPAHSADRLRPAASPLHGGPFRAMAEP